MFSETKTKTPERPDYFYTQSAVVPYRHGPNGVEILLITSRGRRRWVIPKGIVEPFLSPAESACKEAFEEAGIEGEVSDGPLGTYQYEKWGGVCKVEVFLLRVQTEHPHWEESFRGRRWFSVDAAVSELREAALKELVATLPETLDKKSARLKKR